MMKLDIFMRKNKNVDSLSVLILQIVLHGFVIYLFIYLMERY